jgi:hypothetical protein
MFGQLGDGTTIDDLTPEEISLAPGVGPKAISAGEGGLAIGSDAKLYGWGLNSPSGSGNAASTGDLAPQRISLYPDMISAGGKHSLVIGDSAPTRSTSGFMWFYGASAIGGVLLYVTQQKRRTRTIGVACDEQPELPPYL